ncbi:MAG: FG-GAP repeat protein [Planctomycetes bacterium]|nr:FG-GAP repeat protein [Planctomycetota bacterium]
MVAHGSDAGDQLGIATSFLGRTADSLSMVAIGSCPREDLSGKYADRAGYVLIEVLGSERTPIRLTANAGVGYWFGYSLLALGDVNADGVPDVLVGQPNDSEGSRVAAFSGSDGKQLWVAVSELGSSFGESMTMLSDLDEDGVADVAVGSPGSLNQDSTVTIFSGRTGAQLHQLVGANAPGRASHFGISLAFSQASGRLLVGACSPRGWRGMPGKVFEFDVATWALLRDRSAERLDCK